MKRQCPDCKTVTGGHAGYCGACGYKFFTHDPLRPVAKAKTEHGVAVLAGLAIAVLQYVLMH